MVTSKHNVQKFQIKFDYSHFTDGELRLKGMHLWQQMPGVPCLFPLAFTILVHRHLPALVILCLRDFSVNAQLSPPVQWGQGEWRTLPEQPSTNDWWDLLHKYSSCLLAPWGWDSWLQVYSGHQSFRSGVKLRCKTDTIMYPLLFVFPALSHFPHAPASVSFAFRTNGLQSDHLLLGEPSQSIYPRSHSEAGVEKGLEPSFPTL